MFVRKDRATPIGRAREEAGESVAPLSGTRAQAVQRLQVGFSGLAAMILLVGLANIIMNRAQENEASVVPEAAPVASEVRPARPSNPLAEAGVVPDLVDEEEDEGEDDALPEVIDVAPVQP